MLDRKPGLEVRLNAHPCFCKRVESLLNIIEDTHGNADTADAAEQLVIEELRNMGNETLVDWATSKEKEKSKELQEYEPSVMGHGEKKVWWHTTYGKVAIYETLFLWGKTTIRPFCWSADVTTRGYSIPLQRRITDFGADNAFGKISDKLEEHYGIRIPTSSSQAITEKHAETIKENIHLQTEISDQKGVNYMIIETDGCMVPIVETSKKIEEGKPVDRRKTRSVFWKEARLSLAHSNGSLSPVFGGIMGSPDEVGDQLMDCAVRSGVGQQTNVHGVGDGATWIHDQVDRVFGSQGNYLIDFHHLCDYLAPASEACAADAPKAWLEKQKKRVLESQLDDVLQSLKSNLESKEIKDEHAPVRRCYRYIMNRPGQFDYKGAIDNDLPIGSGEIESAHRYVIQNRLKLAGSWWLKNNANNMLFLRTLRANNDWEEYWNNAA